MKMAPCAQEVRGHAASLLTCLNRQREQAQFCDCVLKHKQSSGHLYPAHRCVLAASSPVFASILPSTGALVELQDPCLSDSVLAPLLDYIYTGALPYTHSQQQYYRLLTAACHLQMNELQEALRVAWQQTGLNATDDVSDSTGAEIHPYNSINNSYLKTFRDLPSSPSTDAFERFEETSKKFSARPETLDEALMNSVNRDSCANAGETCISKNIMNHCSRTDASTLESNDSMNVSEYRQVTYTTQQKLVQDTSNTAEVHELPEVNKKVHEDQFHSGSFEKSEIWQRSAEEEQLVSSEDKKSSSSSSLPHPCCGAVPVICHGSRAAAYQLAEECAVLPYHPPFQSPVSSSRSPFSHSLSTDNDIYGDCMTSNQKDQLGAQNLDLRYKEKYIVCRTHLQLSQDSNNSNRNNFIINNNKLTIKGSSHVTDHNDQSAHCDSFQSHIKHLTKDVVVQNKDWSTGDDFHSKSRCIDCFECQSASLEKAKEEHSQNWRVVVPFPVEDSDTGSESHCDDICLPVEAKEEHSYCSRCPTEMDLPDNLYGHNNWYPNSSEESRKDASFSQHEYDSDSRHTAMEHKRLSMDFCLPISTTRESGLDNITGSLSNAECIRFLKSKKISGTNTTVACLTSMPVNKRPPDTACTVSQSNNYLHSHCPPQHAHISHRAADYKYSQPGPSHFSDVSSDGAKADSFGQSPEEPTFCKESTEQVVLVDTNIKPAEQLVSCKHRSDTEDKGVRRDRAKSAIRNHNKAQSNEGPSVTWTEMKKIRKRSKFEGESLDETKGQTKVLRKSVRKDQSRQGTRGIQKTVAEELSNSNEGEGKITPWPVCSTLCEPDPVQASVPSALSACIPSALSDSMPKERSSQLSSPTHQPFQCSLCDRSFSQRGSLNRHVRSHLGVRPFPCPCCPMTFSRQYRVTEHMRVHQRCTLGNDFQKSIDSPISNENRPHS